MAIEELAMHGQRENLMQLTAKGGRLDVDILPGVTVAIRWPYEGVTSRKICGGLRTWRPSISSCKWTKQR